jgi:hypothetical protein
MAAISLLGDDHRFLLWWPVLAVIAMVMDWKMPFKATADATDMPLPLRLTLLVNALLQLAVIALMFRALR